MRRPVLLATLFAALLVGCGGGEAGDGDQVGTTRGSTDRERALEFTIPSEAVGRELDVAAIVPPGGGRGRGLLVFLHGAGGDEGSLLGDTAFREALDGLGPQAPVVAFPEGEEGWWHDRASGDWGTYVLDEVIPAVARKTGADPRRVAIGGISMGGYGAYHLALEEPGRFCGVGGHSAGLWTEAAAEYPGAFDDPADYAENDVLAAVESDPEAFGETPVWNDYGNADWFVLGNEAFVAALEAGRADLTAGVSPGGHDIAYWDAHFHEYLEFYADALADC